MRTSVSGQTVLFETSSYLFTQIERDLKDYTPRTPLARILDRRSQRLVQDYGKTYPGFEWLLAQESKNGVIATLDSAIEGRAWEVPVIVKKKDSHSWKIILFKKPHFSADIIALELHRDTLRLRLRIDPGTAPKSQITGTMNDARGEPMDFADWEYSFQKPAWKLVTTALTFGT
ncbi:MAG: hypothetical protein RJB38_337 [Pseudomonadota bacterium]